MPSQQSSLSETRTAFMFQPFMEAIMPGVSEFCGTRMPAPSTQANSAPLWSTPTRRTGLPLASTS